MKRENYNNYNFSNITAEDVKNNPIVKSFIESANKYLGALGYTEHGMRHVSLIAQLSENILQSLDYHPRLAELAKVAAYLHDIGNVVNRHNHGQSAALMAMRILKDMGATPQEIALVISAIGNHEEEIGDPVNPVSAALILADKSDVHKTRVRNPNEVDLADIHDRVNFAAERSFLQVLKDKKLISLKITIDTKISKVTEYFEIFMSRMIISRRAANYLGCDFELIINERKLL
jgi:metal-dependent HD superfamily phosphatase/phosphodiesterase